MKNLHRKIIAGSLISIISIGVNLSHGVNVFANSILSGSSSVIEEQMKWSDEYIQYASKRFSYVAKKVENIPSMNIKEYFRNPDEFMVYLYDNGMKQGSNLNFWICGQYYNIEFNKKIDEVDAFLRWEDDKIEFKRYGDFIYDKYFKNK